MSRNPSFKPVEYQAPTFKRPPKIHKASPEDLLPWRMFDHYGPQTCKRCGQKVEATFIIAKNRKNAQAIFDKGNGFSSSCMCNILVAPDRRIKTLDGGIPNPSVLKIGEVPPETYAIPRNISPYRLFKFAFKELQQCACGRNTHYLYTVAVSDEIAASRLKKYGQCSICICETLCLPRYAIETTWGGPP